MQKSSILAQFYGYELTLKCVCVYVVGTINNTPQEGIGEMVGGGGLGWEISSKPRTMINSTLHLRPMACKRKTSRSLHNADPLLCLTRLNTICSPPRASLSPCQLLNGQLQQQGFCAHRTGFSVSACDFSDLTLQAHHHTEQISRDLHGCRCLPADASCCCCCVKGTPLSCLPLSSASGLQGRCRI